MSNEAITLTPDDLKKINRAVREWSETKSKVEVYNESMKELKKATVDDLKKNGLTAKRLTTMMNLYHNNTQEEYFQEQDELEVLMENTFPKK